MEMIEMRVLRLHGPRDMRFHDEPIPQPAPGEVRIKVKSVGICASDCHYYRDARIGSTVLFAPLVLGHEASGVIDALGDGVAGLRVGDKVAIEPAKPCMQCEHCKAGHYNVCPDIPFFGTPPTDGCLREFITWPASLALKAPDSMSYDDAAMIEPLAIGVHAVNMAQAKAGDTVAILGAGAIGLSVLQALRAKGIERIVVSEIIPERINLARELGAMAVVDRSAGDVEDDISSIFGGGAPNIVFECAGTTDAVGEASRIVGILGRVVVVGIPDGNEYPFDASAARRKEISAIFLRRSNNTAEETIDMVAEGIVNAAKLATHSFVFDHTIDAIELAMSKSDGVVRAMVHIDE